MCKNKNEMLTQTVQNCSIVCVALHRYAACFHIFLFITRAGTLLGAERAGPGGLFEHPPPIYLGSWAM